MTVKFYEEDIKQLILEKKHVFIKDKDTQSAVLFEKGLDVNSVIADCLIFTSDGNIIGVEIKTERDSTKRLNKQLKSYSKVCDYVYVLCEDKHVDKVEDILHNYNHTGVGIIAYTEFKGEPILGVYQQASKSPTKSVVTAYMSLFWREELLNIAGSFKRQVSTLEEKGLSVAKADSRGAVGMNGLLVQSSVSKRMKKPQIAKTIVDRLGEHKANHLLCNIYINKKLHPEKQLNYYHFKGEE
ncbi:hypothetical protein KAMFAM_202 [Bacillus phage Kamfam]|nr:hypothetical protein OTK52_200 [Bacillus phage OTooleKemple52]AXQ67149.1 hypothetical protein KAMFAM_202 [Bacillus phage Kamfam]